MEVRYSPDVEVLDLTQKFRLFLHLTIKIFLSAKNKYKKIGTHFFSTKSVIFGFFYSKLFFRQMIAYPLTAYSHEKSDSQKNCYKFNMKLPRSLIFHYVVENWIPCVSFWQDFFYHNLEFFLAFFFAFLISNTLNFHYVK